MSEATEKKKAPQKKAGSCESCEFFDYDELSDSESCMLSLDEDEFADFFGAKRGGCPYYRYYDEYKSVQKQN